MTNDIDELTALNLDFVASAQNSDVRRFDEILAPEFYCSNPDKSLVDRAVVLVVNGANGISPGMMFDRQRSCSGISSGGIHSASCTHRYPSASSR